MHAGGVAHVISRQTQDVQGRRTKTGTQGRLAKRVRWHLLLVEVDSRSARVPAATKLDGVRTIGSPLAGHATSVTPSRAAGKPAAAVMNLAPACCFAASPSRVSVLESEFRLPNRTLESRSEPARAGRPTERPLAAASRSARWAGGMRRLLPVPMEL